MGTQQSVRDAINRALAECAEEQGWTETKIAVVAGVSQQAAHAWITGKAGISGDKLILLMRELPGLRERLLPERAA